MSSKQRLARQAKPGDRIRRETEYQKPENQLRSGFVHRETPLADKIIYERLQGKAYQGPTTSLTGATMNPGLVAAYPGGQVKPGEPSSVRQGNQMSASRGSGQKPTQRPQTARPRPAQFERTPWFWPSISDGVLPKVSKRPVPRHQSNTVQNQPSRRASSNGQNMAPRQNNPRQQANDPEADAKSSGHTEEQGEKHWMDTIIAHSRLCLQPTCTPDQFIELMFKKLPPDVQSTLPTWRDLRSRLTDTCSRRRKRLKYEGVHVLSQPDRTSADKNFDIWNQLYHARYIIDNWHSLKAGMAVLNAYQSGRENALPEVLGISPGALLRLSDTDMNEVVSPQDVIEATAFAKDLEDFGDSLGLHSPAATASEPVSNTGSSRMQDRGKGKDKIPPLQESRFAVKSQSNRPTRSGSIDWEVPESDEEATVVADRETPSGDSSRRRDKRKRDSSATGPRKKKRKPQLPTKDDTVVTITSGDELVLPATRHQSRGPSRSSPAPQSRSRRGGSVRSPGPSLTQQEMTPPDSTPCHRKPSPPTPNPIGYIRGRTADYQGIPFHKREKAMDMHQKEMNLLKRKHQYKKELEKGIKVEDEDEVQGDIGDGSEYGDDTGDGGATSDKCTSDESEDTSDKDENRRDGDYQERERKLEQDRKRKEEEEKERMEKEKKLKTEKKKKKEEREEKQREEKQREERQREERQRDEMQRQGRDPERGLRRRPRKRGPRRRGRHWSQGITA
ncbi:unnamed protein product [Clonostachys rhizophaga]|uniref:Uncharacterized protein n=1 Tax=Clonostachys rhizophaga TaxID=160324 RepID=A0A9N9VXN2_9HYPO|nr:unnamed protein product [Clonostachys rhizophaga]